MKLICKECKLDITKQLRELRDLSLIDVSDGKDYIPQGFYKLDTEKNKGNIIVNIKDVINSMYHADRGRLNGCCGRDGLDGINRVCLNNHEIGTEMSDCWMPHYISLESEMVDWSE